MMSEAFSIGIVLDQGLLQLGVVDLLQRLGGRLGVQRAEDGGAVVVAQVLQDVGQLGRVQLGELLVGHVQLERPGAREQLHVLPPDQVVGQLVAEEPLQRAREPLFPAEAPHQPAQPDIEVHQAQLGVDAQEVQVVHPHHLGAEGVHDLLVEDLLAQADRLGRGGRRRCRRPGPASRPASVRSPSRRTRAGRPWPSKTAAARRARPPAGRGPPARRSRPPRARSRARRARPPCGPASR